MVGLMNERLWCDTYDLPPNGSKIDYILNKCFYMNKHFYTGYYENMKIFRQMDNYPNPIDDIRDVTKWRICYD